MQALHEPLSLKFAHKLWAKNILSTVYSYNWCWYTWTSTKQCAGRSIIYSTVRKVGRAS